MTKKNNNIYMKKHFQTLTVLIFSGMLLAACGGGAKDKKGEIADMKVKLEKLKKKKNDLDADIRKLETDIDKADPAAAKKNAKLVAVDSVKVDTAFAHYIELQGKINTDEGIAYVAPKGQGGLVSAILVKPGQRVGKGQLVAKLDDAVARQQVVTAQQQTGVLKARLAQAQTIYERYENLWKQNIGAEIQVINAKADVDALAAQLRAAQAGVAQAQEAVNMSNVYAGISGTVEQVNVRPGEFFSGVSPDRKPQILIVNDNASLKAEVPVPDKYAKSVIKGAIVNIDIPDLDTTINNAKITMVGGSIDPVTRSFMAEAKLGINKKLKPNLTITMRIQDAVAKNAIVVPRKFVQTDEQGKYVYVMVKEGDKMVARKKNVTVSGEVYKGLIQIGTGLSRGELVITEGFQTVYDGQTITTGN
jgi:membrane fusion protein, multidrug efflux system